MTWEEQIAEHFSPARVAERQAAYEAKWRWLVYLISFSTGILGLATGVIAFLK